MVAFKRDFHAYLDQIQMITILLPYSYHNGGSSLFLLKNENVSIPLTIKETIPLKECMKYVCFSECAPEIGRSYWVFDEHGGKTDLQIGSVIRSTEFDDLFYYDGPLGYDYDQERTIFKVWAPTASQVQLKLYTTKGIEAQTIMMNREERGVWSTRVEQDLELFCYTFNVCVNSEWKEAVDPYTVSVIANGKLGVIVDLKKTRVEKIPLPPLKYAVDSIIYETHIRDFTIHKNSGVHHKGTYIGAGEIDTKDPDGRETCLSYVKSLGITHIEFLPVHDFEGVDELGDKKEYNWGYNPTHFNVPDGSYCTDPTDPYARIIELKRMISAIHYEGIRVILDVVYNHVYIREESSFEKIVPGYYFRHNEHGMPTNGTGVGNDIASERSMVKKYIIDSVKFWMNEYQVDGFRFDLMGILDIDTMNEVWKVVNKIDSNAIIIGEGWDLNTPLPLDKKANIRNQKQLPQVGQFNDWFRDSIKGSTFNLYDLGYALGNEHYYEAAKQVLAGSIDMDKRGIFSDPNQSVNYIESHDNHTFWDKLKICFKDEQEEVLKRKHRLATTMVLLAQGVPFLHSGQEFFRTKEGIGNSYKSPDKINQLDWDRKAANIDNVEYIKGIIEIRKSHRAFRLTDAQEIRKFMRFLPLPRPVIAYYMEDVGGIGKWEKIIVLFNPTLIEHRIVLPERGWEILANHSCASGESVEYVREYTTTVKPLSTYVFVK